MIYNAEGEAISEVRSDSIQDYARRMLDKEETKDKDKSLYVEMLNYGAAAQVKFGYDTENLVNSIITAQEQKTYGISGRVYENQRQTADGYKGTSLKLESRILLNIVYEASFVTEGNAIFTVQDTVEGYVARMDTSDPLYEAIMKFADAAYLYFHN